MGIQTNAFNGNVGIGKVNPAFALDVAGVVNACNLYVNGSAYVGSQWTSSNASISITGSNVGIGTTAPQKSLHVSGDAQVDSNLWLGGQISMQGLCVSRNNGSVANIITTVTSIPGYTWNSNVTLAAANSNYAVISMIGTAEAMRVAGNGYVGVGTALPQKLLHVGGDVQVDGQIALQGLCVSRGNGTGSNVGGGSNVSSAVTWTTANGSNSVFVLGSNVGIGTSTPAFPLDVAGNINCSGNLCAGNLGVFRNRVINGDMRLAQRGTTATSGTGTGTYYGTVDRFRVDYSVAAGGLTQTQQTLATTDSPYNYGFRYSYRVTASTACTSVSYIIPGQAIEGLNVADLNWGSAAGTSATVSFWLRTNAATSSVTSLTIRNGAANMCYNAPITITASGSWQYVTCIVPPPPNASTWASDTTLGMTVMIGGYLQGGQSSSPNTWQAANYVGTTAGTNIYGTINNYVEFTGLQLEKGTIATPFEFMSVSAQLQQCQRYYEKSFALTTPPAANVAAEMVIMTTGVTSSNYCQGCLAFKTPKRSTGGTASLYNPYNAVATNSTLRVPGAALDITISNVLTSTGAIVLTMGSSNAYCYSTHFSYDNEL